MLRDFAIFLVLMALILSVFTMIGYTLFKDVEEYSRGYLAAKTLISSMLGGFDFAVLDGAELGETTGAIFLTIYLIIGNVLALNLLIAVLSNVYAEESIKANLLYLGQVLTQRPILEYDRDYGALTSSVPVWNITLVPAIPFYLAMKDTARLNHVLLHINYIPVLVIAVSFFFVVSLLLTPLAWLKGIALHGGYLFNSKLKQSTLTKITQFLIFLLFGLLIIMLNNLVDLYYFVKHLYCKDLIRKEKSEKLFAVPKDNLR